MPRAKDTNFIVRWEIDLFSKYFFTILRKGEKVYNCLNMKRGNNFTSVVCKYYVMQFAKAYEILLIGEVLKYCIAK